MKNQGASILAALLAAAPLFGSTGAGLRLDPKSGNIGGLTATAIFPAAGKLAPAVEGLPAAVGDPAGLEVHLAPTDDPVRELLYESGVFFLPPSGRTYRMWLEGEGRISPFAMTLKGQDLPFKEQGKLIVQNLVPAGRVALPGALAPPPGAVLRLLSVEPGGETAPDMSRRAFASASGAGVQMPAGRTLLSLWDAAGRMLGISRPFELGAGQLARPELTPPRPGTTHVLAILEKRFAVKATAQAAPAVLLETAAGTRRSDLTFATHSAVYLVFYDAPAGRSRLLNADPGGVGTFAPQPLDLVAGRLERLLVDLQPLP